MGSKQVLILMFLQHWHPLTSSPVPAWESRQMWGISSSSVITGETALTECCTHQAVEQVISCSLTAQITAIKGERRGLLRPAWRRMGRNSLLWLLLCTLTYWLFTFFKIGIKSLPSCRSWCALSCSTSLGVRWPYNLIWASWHYDNIYHVWYSCKS